MPYDSNLDSQIFIKSWESEDTKVNVCVYSYNNGPKKLQIGRENKDAEGNYRFSKLGRLTQEEAKAILPLIEEAISKM